MKAIFKTGGKQYYVTEGDKVFIEKLEVEAGQKVTEQQKALEKDSRTAEQIVNEVLENGKAEIGIEANKDNIER